MNRAHPSAAPANAYRLPSALAGLTPKQSKLLDYLRAFIAEHRYSPSFDEIQIALGLKSKSGVHRLVTALEQRGYARRIPGYARSIEVIREAPAGEPQQWQPGQPEVVYLPLHGRIE